jgi:hypothetical protein
MGFLSHLLGQVFPCAPQPTLKGVSSTHLGTPIRWTVFQNNARHKRSRCTPLHSNSLQPSRFTQRPPRHFVSFVCSPLEPSLRVAIVVQKQEPRASALVPDAISSSSYQHQAQKPSFHSFHFNTLRPFRSSTDYATFRSIHSRCL